ncbi:MAG TPA: hypothetical protein VJ583_05665 [Nitrososphaeraceae archaeon]|nr:hypothetical protein [Nitrososphaeraceae archaeon]
MSIVNAQENIEELYPKTTTTNLTPPIFGEPIYKETSRQSSNSIVLNDDGSSIQTRFLYYNWDFKGCWKCYR